MAIVKGPALSLEASGNLGAICYSRYRGLQIARDTWTGTYPGTTKQLAINASMTTVSQAWGGTLLPAEREAWVEAAREQTWKNRLGGDFIPSGYMYYMKLNLVRAFLGLGILKMPPAKPTEVYADRFEPVWMPAKIQIWGRLQKFASGYYPDGVFYYRAGPYNSGGRSPIEGEWRFLVKQLPDVYFKDGDLVSYKWYWYRAKWYLNEGITGNFFVAQVQAQFVT